MGLGQNITSPSNDSLEPIDGRRGVEFKQEGILKLIRCKFCSENPGYYSHPQALTSSSSRIWHLDLFISFFVVMYDFFPSFVLGDFFAVCTTFDPSHKLLDFNRCFVDTFLIHGYPEFRKQDANLSLERIKIRKLPVRGVTQTFQAWDKNLGIDHAIVASRLAPCLGRKANA